MKGPVGRKKFQLRRGKLKRFFVYYKTSPSFVGSTTHMYTKYDRQFAAVPFMSISHTSRPKLWTFWSLKNRRYM